MKLIKKGLDRLVEVSILESPDNPLIKIEDHKRFANQVFIDKSYCSIISSCHREGCKECHDIFIKKYKLPKLK